MAFVPTLAQIELQDGGMSYAAQISEGKFILIDGGQSFENDGERLYNYLSAKKDTGKIIIAAWIFTHGHFDHIALATEFIKKYRSEIIIENILFDLPLEAPDFYSYPGEENHLAFEKEFIKTINSLKNTNLIEAKAGAEFDFSSVTVQVLSTHNERYPNPPVHRNNASAVYRLIFQNGVSFMVTGDAQGERIKELMNPDSPTFCTDVRLKSDILQVAHHGLRVSDECDYEAVLAFYKKISPKVVFWPIGKDRFLNDGWIRDKKYIYNDYLLTKAREKNFHHSVTAELNLNTLDVKIL